MRAALWNHALAASMLCTATPPPISPSARATPRGAGALYLIVSEAWLSATAIPGEPMYVDAMSLLVIKGDLLGWSFTDCARDLNGDGLGEVADGARSANGRSADTGAVYRIAGKKYARRCIPKNGPCRF